MNTDRIDELLARYHEAETTIAEERELKQLLATPGLPVRYAQYASYFRVQRVLAKAEPLNAASFELPRVSARTPAERPLRARRASRTSRIRRYVPALAAVLAVTIIASVALFRTARSSDETSPFGKTEVAEAPTTQPIDWSRFEVTDPDEATRITRAALAQVSNRIDRGSRITSKHVSRIEPIQHAL